MHDVCGRFGQEMWHKVSGEVNGSSEVSINLFVHHLQIGRSLSELECLLDTHTVDHAIKCRKLVYLIQSCSFLSFFLSLNR